jgi:hypothetical protein
MGDAGEGLVDADSRIQELRDQREAEKRERANAPIENPEALRARQSLVLARASLTQQLEASTHPVRRQQLEAAIKDLDDKLSR